MRMVRGGGIEDDLHWGGRGVTRSQGDGFFTIGKPDGPDLRPVGQRDCDAREVVAHSLSIGAYVRL